jgi:hypothetical protein
MVYFHFPRFIMRFQDEYTNYDPRIDYKETHQIHPIFMLDLSNVTDPSILLRYVCYLFYHSSEEVKGQLILPLKSFLLDALDLIFFGKKLTPATSQSTKRGFYYKSQFKRRKFITSFYEFDEETYPENQLFKVVIIDDDTPAILCLVEKNRLYYHLCLYKDKDESLHHNKCEDMVKKIQCSVDDLDDIPKCRKNEICFREPGGNYIIYTCPLLSFNWAEGCLLELSTDIKKRIKNHKQVKLCLRVGRKSF